MWARIQGFPLSKVLHLWAVRVASLSSSRLLRVLWFSIRVDYSSACKMMHFPANREQGSRWAPGAPRATTVQKHFIMHATRQANNTKLKTATQKSKLLGQSPSPSDPPLIPQLCPSMAVKCTFFCAPFIKTLNLHNFCEESRAAASGAESSKAI